jgi:predicted DNA-binding transcriptional regulator YafY
MTGTADRLPRLLALVPYLRTHQGAELTDVAAVFGINVRQLRDDLNLLWVCGLPGGGPGDLLDFAFEGETVSVLETQTLDRPLKLTADEALALRVAARALADVPGLAERGALESAQAKLAMASADLPELAELSDPSGTAPLQVALEPESDVLSTVRAALESGRTLELRYLVASRDEVTERVVTPMRLVSVDGRWYLEGWCQLADGVRLFRLDRMVEAVAGAAAEPLPSEAVPRDLAEGLFRPRAEDLTVVLELEPAARWIADYYPVEQATELDPSGEGLGRLRVELRTPDPAWVVRLALRLGGQGRVVAPPSVVAAVREQAEKGLEALRGL